MRAVLILAVLLAWVWCVVAVVGLTGYLVAIAAANLRVRRRGIEHSPSPPPPGAVTALFAFAALMTTAASAMAALELRDPSDGRVSSAVAWAGMPAWAALVATITAVVLHRRGPARQAADEQAADRQATARQATARQATARQAADEQAAASDRAGLKVAVVLVVGCVVLAGLVFGQYRLRQATSGGDGPVCIVTPKSLERAPQRYDGVDHPLDPRDGDQYRNTAGCLVGEVSCWRSIEIIGNRLYCST